MTDQASLLLRKQLKGEPPACWERRPCRGIVA